MPSRPACKAVESSAGVNSRVPCAAAAARRKKLPYSMPLAPPTVDISVIPANLKKCANLVLACVFPVDLVCNGGKPTRNVQPVVGIADRGVELCEIILGSLQVGCGVGEPAAHGLGVYHRECCHGYIPQRRAGVWTGASQKRRISSSTRVSVIEQPAISSDVTYGPMRLRTIWMSRFLHTRTSER